jgi:hypothetical protein
MANYLSTHLKNQFTLWFNTVVTNSNGAISFEEINGNYILHINDYIWGLNIFPKLFGDVNDFTCKVSIIARDTMNAVIDKIYIPNPTNPDETMTVNLMLNTLKLNTIEFKDSILNPEPYGIIQNSQLKYNFLSGYGGNLIITPKNSNIIDGIYLYYQTITQDTENSGHATWPFNYIDITFENMFSTSIYFEIYQIKNLNLNLIQNNFTSVEATVLANAQNGYNMIFDFEDGTNSFIKCEGILSSEFTDRRQWILSTAPDPTNYPTIGFSIELDQNHELIFDSTISSDIDQINIYPKYNVETLQYIGADYEYFKTNKQTYITGGTVSGITIPVIINSTITIPEYTQATIRNQIDIFGNISFKNEVYQESEFELEILQIPTNKQLVVRAILKENNLEIQIKTLKINLFKGISFAPVYEASTNTEYLQLNYIFEFEEFYKIEYEITSPSGKIFNGIRLFHYKENKNFFERSETFVTLDSDGKPKTIIYDYPDRAHSVLRFIEELSYDAYNNLIQATIKKITNIFTFNYTTYENGWFSGEPLEILWSFINIGIINVKLEISYDLGNTWEIITPTTPNDGSYIWMPNKYSPNTILKISNVLDSDTQTLSPRFNLKIDDEFNALTEINYLNGDGDKSFGWNLLNSSNFTTLDANISNFSELTLDVNAISNWNNSGQLYKIINGDFDIEIRMLSWHSEDDAVIGIFAGSTINDSDMIVCGFGFASSTSKSVSLNIENNIATETAVSGTKSFFRLKKSGTTFTSWHKDNAEDNWALIASYIRLLPNILNVGIIAKKQDNDGVSIETRLGYFKAII